MAKRAPEQKGHQPAPGTASAALTWIIPGADATGRCRARLLPVAFPGRVVDGIVVGAGHALAAAVAQVVEHLLAVCRRVQILEPILEVPVVAGPVQTGVRAAGLARTADERVRCRAGTPGAGGSGSGRPGHGGLLGSAVHAATMAPAA
ncbi:hypothetical protein D0Y53_01900 [Luteimonas weifangensis]|uniref:Uncharacterized protein n=1 Tax=Cognatiluteimonas weifangensis TaxID=2303539 RepID=A0A372DQK3_9GAMM|nr:hypothetical protein D0Y53_01900 [Luteimonas weifangensis]